MMLVLPLLAVSTFPTPSAAPRVARPALRRPVPARTASPADLLSPRARRLAALYLRMRLLELRGADLERARAVIEGRLGVDALLRSETQRTNAR